jgi:ataxia telangiectasia mutated family protein
VFHEFAAFCDKQLQNPENLEDFQRVKMLRERKQGEVQDLERMIKAAGSQTKEKDNLENHRKKAQLWYTLDDREYQRLKQNREAFIRQSIENYLLALRACDNYNSDALRFSALWLEHSDSETANAAVSKYIDDVGSRKFASLMNQWTSRLLDASNDFQKLLSALVVRICVDHPYHGMYQVFASSKTKGGKDQAALSRNAAALNIVARIKANKRSGHTWLSVHNSNINFVRFASEKLDDSKYKPGSKVPLRKSINGPKLEQDIPSHPIPPPTMKIKLRADCDYSKTPLIVSYQSEFTIASGISMPKILTAFASDGRKYKQLFKGGNDDLRQDCIMEQVFEQVSNLLKSHRDTRQRNLGIRTYKVLPLTSTTGIIEFVSDTVPLHEYLLPAHQRHFPGDLKPNMCRKHIADVQNKSVEIRVKTFRNVCDKFHPVLHYFFMERFENPDEWFERRLAYTRSMAANSILGYIMGLGDRHGHNILLDEKTGEVVHIDLGIAFEQGRVLPVPEVVPFRLTRDLVDAMGITKTEGVFRRCCEFTMDALRNELYSIMTILDVLRYDPLYSWSLSPVRLKRLQDNQTEINVKSEKPVDDDASQDNKQENEPGEADRALTVVSKKLSKTLSVTATVNELIQQATDERNLAVLFCGWAAYA